VKLSVVSPTLNEAANVPVLVEQLACALGDIDYEILIVDDNSPDRTWSIAQEISSKNPRVRSIRRMENPGLGMAVIDGFSEATGDMLACIDADLQHDPAILPKMLEELQTGADVVVGSRHVDGGSTGEWTRLRRLESWVAGSAAQFLLGFKLKDPMSGFFLVWREDFHDVKADLDGNGFKILLEIVARLHRSNIKEVPYTFRPRTAGESKLSSKVALQYVRQLWRLCSASQRASVRFLKTAMVGSVGLFINLAVMASLLAWTSLTDWRASAVACLVANVQNFVLTDFWTDADRSRGFRKLGAYYSYLWKSAAGLTITTGAYAALIWTLSHSSHFQHGARAQIFLGRLACQFAGVLLGIRLNYALSNPRPQPELSPLDLKTPERPTIPVSTD
jgi:dolichol-phosphate mannosyltransferase